MMKDAIFGLGTESGVEWNVGLLGGEGATILKYETLCRGQGDGMEGLRQA